MDVLDIFILAVGLLEVLHKLQPRLRPVIIMGLGQHAQRGEEIHDLFHVLQKVQAW